MGPRTPASPPPERRRKLWPADLDTAALSLHAELAVDYFELRSADAQQRLLDQTVEQYADMVKLTVTLLDGGAAPESDVIQARTQLDTALVQETDTE